MREEGREGGGLESESSCRGFLLLVPFMPDSLPLLRWKLLAFLESIKTSWGFKVIIKSIMFA